MVICRPSSAQHQCVRVLTALKFLVGSSRHAGSRCHDTSTSRLGCAYQLAIIISNQDLLPFYIIPQIKYAAFSEDRPC
jgi:hypothetical protein